MPVNYFRSCKCLLVFGALALLVACGQPVGTPCQISGSGFHAKDPCAHQCLSRWAVNCPDGSRLTPNVCTGKQGCTPGSCPDGQVCYNFDDPFDERSYCIPDTACGSPPSADQRLRWEQDSAIKAAEMRAKYATRRALQSGATTTKEEPVEPPATETQ